MNAIATIQQGRRTLYLYPDGTMIPMIAGGHNGSPAGLGSSEHASWHLTNSAGSGSSSNEIDPTDSQYRPQGIVPPRDMSSLSGYYGLDGRPLMWRELMSWNGAVSGDPMGATLYFPRWTPARRVNGVYIPGSWTFDKATAGERGSVINALTGDGSGTDTRDYAGEQAAADARAAAEAQKQRDFQAAQNEMDREIQRQNQARQEREARLNALLDNIRYLNEIQPDLARFGAGLNSVPLQGITPTVGYGNALEGNISTLQGQLQNPPPLGTPIPQVAPAPTLAGTGMAGGGSILPGSATMNIGTTKRGVLVGDREINGDEELLTMDPRTGEVEVIPIVGRAAEGAQFNFSDYGMTPATWNTETLFGALSPLYQPFGITSASNVRTRANAQPTDYGYITPKFTTDFAPVQPPAYGALSQQYFDRNRGMLLPNPTTIMPQLRALRANDPVGFANVLSIYETATDQQGNPSPLPAEAIIQFLENSALSGRSLGFIGVR